MTVQDWQIKARVGQSTAYGDYNNILIIKGVRGALVDLVSTPDVWTQSQDFSIPTSAGGTGDTAEIVVLSQWLANYLQAALAPTSPYFDNFKSIVIDEHWTGILVLKASLTDLPSNLCGLLSVVESSQCFAHHFGITISPVRINQAANTPPIGNASSSSIFQLIYYVNPAVDPTQPIHVLPPTQQPYDFKLLTLKALFKNTSVKAFESYAQLTLDQFFGDAVDHMGDPANTYNTIMLTGAYQQQGGVGTFLLDSVADNLFFLNSAALNKAEIVRAQFNTINRTTLRFDLWGYLDFRVLAAVDDTQKPPQQDVPFDLFGFGSTDDPTAARQGLSFSTLGVVMDTSATPPVFAFDTRVISFDASRPRSTPRDGSIYQAFALNLRGLLSGDADDDPSAENYLTVPTTAPLSGVSGQPWYALEFDLNLGTIGALAGKAGLNARLITAWAPGPLTPPATTGDPTFYPAMVGLRLPGVTTKAKLLSLEGVLAISIGDIRLTYSVPNTQTTSRYCVLWLTDIALKFLGLLKIPPNGAVSFASFDNPQSGRGPTALCWHA